MKDKRRIRDSHGIDRVMEAWSKGALPGEIAVTVTDPPRVAVTVPFPQSLDPRTVKALVAGNISAPYSHQADAWDILGGNRDLLVATPTASGKTLCYNVPILDRLITDPDSRALYLFPTKALARDQEASIRSLIALSGSDVKAVVYDGDTPAEVRRKARREARVIITNPDMLHTGILPHHTSWSSFFAGLSHVVVDEIHQYRGVFGSHVANVMRRLLRVAAFHGSAPVFAACSATIGNPADLGRAVLGRPVELITDSGAPGGRRTFMVYNPEEVDPILGLRRSAIKVASRMAGDLVREGVTTLVFCQTRRGVEIALKYLKDRLRRGGVDPKRVRGYRGGYLPNLRREIETLLRNGELDAVVATNALELGIDVGELDAVVLAGYPGTIAATHQRCGRAGRRGSPSLAVMVASSKPLDQFLVREPRHLVDASPEQALVQPDNIEILLAHLKCAVFEVPFAVGDGFGSLTAMEAEEALELLALEGALSRNAGKFHYIEGAYPAGNVGLRTALGDRVVVVNCAVDSPLGEMDRDQAKRELHPGAIYQHDGDTFRVGALDLEGGKALVEPMEPVYYTVPHSDVILEVIEATDQGRLPGGDTGRGDVKVVTTITGYKKVKFQTHENLGFEELSLPPQLLETEATWISPSVELVGGWKRERLLAALDGLTAAVNHVASLRLMCDPRDFQTTIQEAPDCGASLPEGVWIPALFLYDAHSGGVGLSDRAFDDAKIILEESAALIEGCRCDNGCPACVGPSPSEGPPVKVLAAALARGLLGQKVVTA